MTPLDTAKLVAIWLLGLALVACLALVAWGARLKGRIRRTMATSEALWDQPVRDVLPHDHPTEDDTEVQAIPVATGYVTDDGPRWRLREPSRSWWPQLDMGLVPPPDTMDGPLDPLARPGEGFWTGD